MLPLQNVAFCARMGSKTMTHFIRRFAAAVFASLAFALPASATSFSTDYTDLWYIPAESGWGVNVIQQGNKLFATLFVYGTDQTARWYVASDLTGSSNTAFSGALYQTSGPYFGVGWTVGGPAVQVGTMTFNFNTPTTASLTYSVNGVTVNKAVQRQSFAGNNLGGSFLGGLVATASGCATTSILVFNQFIATHNGASQQVSIPVQFFAGNGAAATCTFNGTYTQAGKLGNVAGTWSCTTGNTGSFAISQIALAITGWSGRFNGNDQFCTYTGYFGGTKDVL
jgi:hypothetical protein